MKTVKSYYQKKTKSKKFSLLKSPHVNKSAQEQFEYRIHTKKLFVHSAQHLKFLYFLKKTQSILFPFVKIKLIGHLNEELQFNSINNRIKSNKLNLGFLNFNNKPFNSSLYIQYFNLLDSNGEYNIQKCVNSKLLHL